MRAPLLLMLATIAATWDAWRWYCNRIAAAPEEGAALGLTIVFLIALSRRERGALLRPQRTPTDPKINLCHQGSNDLHPGAASKNLPRRAWVPACAGMTLWVAQKRAESEPLIGRGIQSRRHVTLPLWTVSVLLAIYAAGFELLPPIGRAALAILATLSCLYAALMSRRPPAAFWGLVALSLPVLPSLQFTFGFGMRVVSATLSVLMLRAQGLDVERQGTFLIWRGEMLQFDAPCSGINMLWAGLLIALMGALAFNLSNARTALVVAASLLLSVFGNVLRATSLFFVEAGLLGEFPAWAHEAVGVAAFLMAAAGLLWLLRTLEPSRSVPA